LLALYFNFQNFHSEKLRMLVWQHKPPKRQKQQEAGGLRPGSKIELNEILEGDEQNEEEDEDDDASTSNLLHADDAIANGRAKLMRPDAASAALVRLLTLYSL
jgi:hypothetical protein